MLFMHKNADMYVNHAVYSGSRPKDNEDSYVQVKKADQAAVEARVRSLMPLIGIDAGCAVELGKIIREWIAATEHDESKKTIYEMMGKGGIEERKSRGVLANWRYYNNYIDLVLALYGEYRSSENLKIENKVAKLIFTSAGVQSKVRSVAAKISCLAEKKCEAAEMDGLLQGSYKDLHAKKDWATWKKECAEFEVQESVPFLYDICSKLKIKLKWEEVPMGGGRINKDNMRINVSTPEEDSNWTAGARWADVPVWAGPSYTTHFILTVAKEAEATEEEIRALAYGIFAYWNQCYPHTATPIHRLYGVMTAAKEFGVPEFACEPNQIYLHAVSFSLM
jgi:hypothetical protein